MFGLKGRQDGFRLLFPKEFICKEIEEKYEKILKERVSFYTTPINFLNETIQKVQVLGFNNATFQQKQSSRGEQFIHLNTNREQENNFMFPATDYNYRSAVSPLELFDRTLNVEFKHTLGYLNYFMLFENFWYQFTRDREYKELIPKLSIDIMNEQGSIYARIVLDSPIIHGMDMLDLDYTQPVAQSQTFKVEFKYSNLDFQFIEVTDNEYSKISIEE